MTTSDNSSTTTAINTSLSASNNTATEPVLSSSAVASAPAAATTLEPSQELIDIEYFSKVKLRVAKIESAEPLPKSNKLLKLQVDVGPEFGKRQVMAGIAKHYKPEDLIGRYIVIVANLKPAKLMGHESQGMLLAGSSTTPEGEFLALLAPDKELSAGSVVR